MNSRIDGSPSKHNRSCASNPMFSGHHSVAAIIVRFGDTEPPARMTRR
jgi:hypothetical protein